MTKYTILSATYANAEHTAIVVQTTEAGAVAVSAADTPDLWAQVTAGPVDVYLPPPSLPIETTKLRFALELKARGMWPVVKAAIAANEDASMYWDFTDIVRSDNQMLLAMADQLAVSAAQVREIITAAAARQV